MGGLWAVVLIYTVLFNKSFPISKKRGLGSVELLICEVRMGNVVFKIDFLKIIQLCISTTDAIKSR